MSTGGTNQGEDERRRYGQRSATRGVTATNHGLFGGVIDSAYRRVSVVRFSST